MHRYGGCGFAQAVLRVNKALEYGFIIKTSCRAFSDCLGALKYKVIIGNKCLTAMCQYDTIRHIR